MPPFGWVLINQKLMQILSNNLIFSNYFEIKQVAFFIMNYVN